LANQPQKQGNQQANPAKTVGDMLQKYEGQIKAALPKEMSSDRLRRIAMTEIRSNPKLMECDPRSLFGAVIQSAQLGLEPGIMGQAYLIPFRNKGQMEVQFIPGFKGLLSLARRSGQIKKVETGVVREGDTFEVEYGTHEQLRHTPGRERGQTEYVYALAKLRGEEGDEPEVQFEVMSVEEVESVRATSKAGNSGPWVDWWEQMARKTVAKRLIKWLPTAVEAQEAVAYDERADAGVSQGNESVIEGDYTASTQEAPEQPQEAAPVQPTGQGTPAMAEPPKDKSAGAPTVEPETQGGGSEAPVSVSATEAAPEPQSDPEPGQPPVEEGPPEAEEGPPMAEAPADDGGFPAFGED